MPSCQCRGQYRDAEASVTRAGLPRWQSLCRIAGGQLGPRQPAGQGSAASAFLAIPIALWEFSLSVYFTVKGFRKEGLQKLGFEPVESVETSSTTARKSELRPAA